VLAGVGMAHFFAPVANVVLSAVRPEEEGQASGANNAIRELGGVFGVAILASIFTSYGGYGSGQHFVNGMPSARCSPLQLASDRRRRRRAARANNSPPNSQPPKQSDETPHPPHTAPDRSSKQARALGASARPVRPLHRSATKLRTSP
jgi:MFS family permease